MIRFLRNSELQTDAQRARARSRAGAEPQTPGQLRAGCVSRGAHRVDGIGVQDAVCGHGHARRDEGAGDDPRRIRCHALRSGLPHGAASRRKRRALCRRALRAGAAVGRPQGDREEPSRALPQYGQGIGGTHPRSQAARTARRNAGRLGRRVRPHTGIQGAATAAITIPTASRCSWRAGA